MGLQILDQLSDHGALCCCRLLQLVEGVVQSHRRVNLLTIVVSNDDTRDLLKVFSFDLLCLSLFILLPSTLGLLLPQLVRGRLAAIPHLCCSPE